MIPIDRGGGGYQEVNAFRRPGFVEPGKYFQAKFTATFPGRTARCVGNRGARIGIPIFIRREELHLEQAGAGLEKIVVGSLRRVPPGEAPLLAWPLVCGSVVAERTRALEFAEAVLRVEVPDAGWKREMQGLAPRYLAMLNRYAGQKVERIEFVIRQD
jgi:Dna[CI] antecedent, DciA